VRYIHLDNDAGGTARFGDAEVPLASASFASSAPPLDVSELVPAREPWSGPEQAARGVAATTASEHVRAHILRATRGRSPVRSGPPRGRSCGMTTERSEWQMAYDAEPVRDADFTTISGVPVAPVYADDDGAELPGRYPYTRGPYASMYRSKLWTMRQFAGFGTAEDTNGRFHQLLRAGGTGLSTAFDMPTLLARDSDHPLALGEVGRAGVAVDTLADMEVLFGRIDLGTVTTSMTINSAAPTVLAMYVALADRNGVERSRLGGTIQNDILKEYQAQNEYVFPPRPSLRLVTDTIRFCTTELPRWHPVSISGYHIREAGSTAAQELAFTLANGFAYVESALAVGLPVDSFAPRLSFFFNAHIDFFEEIAKYRAARRIWAHRMRERYGAKDPRSLQLRFQQVIAHETGVANVADPLGGSWYVEELTDELERRAEAVFDHLEELGHGSMVDGVVTGIEQGWFQGEIAEASYEFQNKVQQGRWVQVGVNAYTDDEDVSPPTLSISPAVEVRQLERLREVKANRSPAAVEAALRRVRDDAADPTVNIFPALLEAVSAYVTVGEITDGLESVFGTYTEGAHA
jgi:methylmalonyl-CoA mutase N-terminal domain/subunit